MKKRNRIGLAGIAGLAVILAAGGCAEKNQSEGGTNKITYWAEFANQSVAGVASFDELPVYQKIQKDLGVDIEFIHPVVGQTQEQLNLMIASREFPDVIQYQFYQYPGGAQKAINDNVIIPLNDVMEKYAPNLTAYLKANKEIDKEVKTDDGKYYCFPQIYGDEYLLTYSGSIIREDLLEKTGLEKPETVDEWYNVLSAFKNELGMSVPYSATTAGMTSTFAQAFHTSNDMFVDNGVVKYGPYESGYKDFVETMRKWYNEGLIDKNIANVDKKTVSQNVLNGNSGMAYGNTIGGIGNWMNAMKDNPEFKLAAVKYPTLNKGDKPMMGHRVNPYSPFGSASVTTQCRDVELAAKVLDYGYSEEGRLTFNFGIEGQTYNMIDGYPTYTDEIIASDKISVYTRPNGAAPTIVDKRYMEQAASRPEQKESIEIWGDADTKEHYLPSINFTEEESTETANLKNEIEAYRDQMLLKFITGISDMSEYDSFVANLKKLGVERYIEIYQGAYDRYAAK